MSCAHVSLYACERAPVRLCASARVHVRACVCVHACVHWYVCVCALVARADMRARCVSDDSILALSARPARPEGSLPCRPLRQESGEGGTWESGDEEVPYLGCVCFGGGGY